MTDPIGDPDPSSIEGLLAGAHFGIMRPQYPIDETDRFFVKLIRDAIVYFPSTVDVYSRMHVLYDEDGDELFVEDLVVLDLNSRDPLRAPRFFQLGHRILGDIAHGKVGEDPSADVDLLGQYEPQVVGDDVASLLAFYQILEFSEDARPVERVLQG